MSKSFRDRRFKKPDYEITAWISGVRHGATGLADWDVQIEGEDDCELAAGILERAAEVLRDKIMTFEEEIKSVINRHGQENLSNTPDFILAMYLMDAMNAFDTAVNRREEWYGRKTSNPATAEVPDHDETEKGQK